MLVGAAGALAAGVLATVGVLSLRSDRAPESTARPAGRVSGGVAGAESPVGTIRPRPQRRLRHEPGQLLVKFADATPRNVAEDLVDEAGGDLEERVRRIDVGVVDVPPGDVAEAIAELRASRQVEYVERDVILETLETRPNDPLWPDQWGPVRVGAPAVWDSVKAPRRPSSPSSTPASIRRIRISRARSHLGTTSSATTPTRRTITVTGLP